MFAKISAWTVLILFSFAISVSGHSGGLDASGGHNDRKNGGYHSHSGGGGSRSRSSVAEPRNISGGSSYGGNSSSFSSVTSSSSQTVYKCKSESGSIIFSSSPCQESGTFIEVRNLEEKKSTTNKDQTSFSSGSKEHRINEYFRGGNENVGALSCGITTGARDVSQSTKDQVKRRDGNKCVICSSTTKLEVDHRRALMNGGENSEDNLFTLCDDCHTDKTRMDNSLKRKRQKLCRN